MSDCRQRNQWPQAEDSVPCSGGWQSIIQNPQTQRGPAGPGRGVASAARSSSLQLRPNFRNRSAFDWHSPQRSMLMQCWSVPACCKYAMAWLGLVVREGQVRCVCMLASLHARGGLHIFVAARSGRDRNAAQNLSCVARPGRLGRWHLLMPESELASLDA